MDNRIKILAFLQNQYFNDPVRAKKLFEDRPDKRNVYIKSFLFSGCLTGRRLQSAFGTEVCNRIIWENASKEIGGTANASFPADHAHILDAISTHKPNVIVTLGKTASEGVDKVVLENFDKDFIKAIAQVFRAPHPAARQYPIPELTKIGHRLKVILNL